MRKVPLSRDFCARDTVTVARALLGQTLVHQVAGVRREGRIVETEAYLGPHDLACHTSRGRTPRTEVMFGPPGHAYVFLVYGLHHCFNVVTGGGAAVLVRALEPLSGLPPGARTDGPGRLTRALGITLAHNGVALDAGALLLVAGDELPARRLGRSPRIGVDYAGPWAKKPLRFFEKGNRWLSGPATSRSG